MENFTLGSKGLRHVTWPKPALNLWSFCPFPTAGITKMFYYVWLEVFYLRCYSLNSYCCTALVGCWFLCVCELLLLVVLRINYQKNGLLKLEKWLNRQSACCEVTRTCVYSWYLCSWIWLQIRVIPAVGRQRLGDLWGLLANQSSQTSKL